MASSSSDAEVGLELHVVEPTKTHQSTTILLHGTSQTGASFAASFLRFSFPYPLPSLSSPSITHTTLSPLFPHTRWVFPTGRPRRTTVFGGTITNAWFDVANFSDRTIGENDQIPGLRESSVLLAKLLKEEIEMLDGRGSVVVGGFSQGSAMSNFLLISGELERLGLHSGSGGIVGIVGMSGWLPFRRQIGEAGSQTGSLNATERRQRVRKYIRNLLDLEWVSCDEEVLDVPVWLAHGEADEKVKVQWGDELRVVLREAGVSVVMETYEGLAHWWDGRELADFVGVVREMLGEAAIR